MEIWNELFPINNLNPANFLLHQYFQWPKFLHFWGKLRTTLTFSVPFPCRLQMNLMDTDFYLDVNEGKNVWWTYRSF
jgi:hypothetical protein